MFVIAKCVLVFHSIYICTIHSPQRRGGLDASFVPEYRIEATMIAILCLFSVTSIIVSYSDLPS